MGRKDSSPSSQPCCNLTARDRCQSDPVSPLPRLCEGFPGHRECQVLGHLSDVTETLYPSACSVSASILFLKYTKLFPDLFMCLDQLFPPPCPQFFPTLPKCHLLESQLEIPHFLPLYGHLYHMTTLIYVWHCIGLI